MIRGPEEYFQPCENAKSAIHNVITIRFNFVEWQTPLVLNVIVPNPPLRNDTTHSLIDICLINGLKGPQGTFLDHFARRSLASYHSGYKHLTATLEKNVIFSQNIFHLRTVHKSAFAAISFNNLIISGCFFFANE